MQSVEWLCTFPSCAIVVVLVVVRGWVSPRAAMGTAEVRLGDLSVKVPCQYVAENFVCHTHLAPTDPLVLCFLCGETEK